MILRSRLRRALALLFLSTAVLAAGCATALGPGYTIEKQEIRVQFLPEPGPRIRIEADYQLRNTGNQPLDKLELRLPGRRRFHYENPTASWDAVTLTARDSTENPRNSMITLAEPWTTMARHTLHLSVEYAPATAGETGLSFTKDAFFLPAQGWSPEFLPPSGLFASGGVPPKKWHLLVTVPDGFQIHTSGAQKKSARRGGELVVRAEQGPKDPYPFVAAGRYSAADFGKGKGKMHLWTSKPQESARLKDVSDALQRVMAAYDAAFGERGNESGHTWIVECPAVAGCFTNLNPSTVKLLGEGEERTTSEMISQDTMVVDLSEGTPNLAANLAPSLATTWLGYGQNPGFYEQQPPLSLLPAFAAATGRDAAVGKDTRVDAIRRALQLIPEKSEPHKPENEEVTRAKSFLFFYALQDQYGREVFRNAVRHMLYARQGRGFELSDLIAAFEQETHTNVAEFVRRWMKRPGVPEEFRARYKETAAATVHAESRSRDHDCSQPPPRIRTSGTTASGSCLR
jgi:hypothetical protein